MENRISYLLQNPSEVVNSDLPILKKAIEQYPYFYHLHALHLFALKNENHPSFEDILHTTSIYSYDRANLFHYIHQPKKVEIPANKTVETIVKPMLLEKAIASEPVDLVKENEELEIADLDNTFDENLNESLQTVENIEEGILEEEQIPVNENVEIEVEFTDENNVETTQQHENIETESPAIVESNQNLSFGDWLKVGQKQHLVIEKETEEDLLKIEKQKVIDNFLANTPKITPLDKENTAPTPVLPSHNQAEFTELMTETLAQIYLEQHKYDKAIRAYKILSLKYPKKNTYFADRISEIEKLKNKK